MALRKETEPKDAVQKEEVIMKSGLPESIITPELVAAYGLGQGLQNLAALPATPVKVPGKDLEEGLIGFDRNRSLAVVCGVEPVQYLSFGKYVALIERADDKRRPNVVLQNYSGGGSGKEVRGQILARLSLKHSAIIVCHGVGGRAMKVPEDILWTYVYSVDQFSLMNHYLAVKTHLAKVGRLDELIEANDGQCVFDVPLDPVNPSR
jgi:hypothetical protein